jgi:D-alanine-D-alanine ligase
MYPKLWEASGLPLPDLLDELIRLAIARKERRSRLSHKPPAELA